MDCGETRRVQLDHLEISSQTSAKHRPKAYGSMQMDQLYLRKMEDATVEQQTVEQQTKHQSEGVSLLCQLVHQNCTSQLYLITSCERPLKRHFERETLANKLFLKKQYFRKEMSEGKCKCINMHRINMHLKEMKELTDKLSSIGAPISEEEDQVVTLLGSLPSSFSIVVTALEARVDDLTLDFVQQQLIHHERKLKAQELKSEAPHDSVLLGYWEIKGGSPQGAGLVTNLDTFKGSVQNEKGRHSTEQRSLKMKLNQAMKMKEHFQYPMKYLKTSG